MKKLAAVALLAALALGSACTATTKVDSTSKTTATTTLRIESGPSQSLCDSTSSEIGGLFTQYAGLIHQITTQAEVTLAISTGHQLVAAGRAFLSACGHFYNASKVQSISNDLDTVENSLNQM